MNEAVRRSFAMSDRDNAIADPRTYSDEDRIHAILKDLRDNDSVHWTAPEGFRPYWHQRVPPNDGGIALGQILAVRRSGT